MTRARLRLPRPGMLWGARGSAASGASGGIFYFLFLSVLMIKLTGSIIFVHDIKTGK
jgi:hypothetical protein